MYTESSQGWISSFWRRIGAVFIDGLILGVVGFVLGSAFEQQFVQLGGWGRVVGFGIALAYFGIGNSAITGGQTVGKRALKIKVVDKSNHPISVARSILRYIILGTPFALNGAQISDDVIFSLLIYPLSVIVLGGLLSILYLYTFNRITRQSLHDLAVGTFVVNVGVDVQEIGKVWRVHYSVVALLLIASALAPLFASNLLQSEPFKGMLSVQESLSSDPRVAYATVTTGTTVFTSTNEDKQIWSYVSGEVVLKENNTSDADLARQLAVQVLENYPESSEKNAIQIALIYGYDIGIWSQWYSYAHNFEPGELQDDALKQTEE